MSAACYLRMTSLSYSYKLLRFELTNEFCDGFDRLLK